MMRADRIHVWWSFFGGARRAIAVGVKLKVVLC